MMDGKAEQFYASLKGKRVAFCGIGGSNLPLIRRFAALGAHVTARDKRERPAIAEAEELEALGVRLILGGGYLSGLDEDIIFRTPGMRFTLPELEAARAHGSVVTSEIEVFLDLCPCRVIGVTGSDGKTTTTTILARMLEAAGKTVWIGGNIGRPLLPDLEKMNRADFVVAELSSFQLISARRSPDVAVVTNLSPNHLDMHRDMAEYIHAKENILLHQNAFGRAVLNADNEIAAGFAPAVRGDLLLFSRARRPARGAYLDETGKIKMALNDAETVVMDASDIRIPGAHNVENYLAAVAALWGTVAPETMREVARTFAGVAHRAELVGEAGGVRWYNDSIATTPSRTVRGMLSLFDRKIILIAGGYDKKVPFEPLGAPVVQKVKTLVLIGATAGAIEAAVRAADGYCPGNPAIVHAASLEEAVEACRRAAQPGDIVALSPACASFDMFPNYETRGDRFRALVQGRG